MITEDYVSFKTAKLLKEKGFVGESEIGCRCGFYEQNKEYPNQINLVYDDLDNSELECNECLRFTHQMALKWLREVHNLCVAPYAAAFRYGFTIDKADTGSNIGNEKTLSIPNYSEITTWEEACEAGIKYCLENLI